MGSTEAPARQEVKNEHIVPLYIRSKLNEYGATTVVHAKQVALPLRLVSLIGSKRLPTGDVGSARQHQHGVLNG